MYGPILTICQGIVLEAGQEDHDVGIDKTFLDYAQLVFDIIADWPKERREHPKLPTFLRQLMELQDDFEREVALDPMVLYKPKCEGIRRFLSSPAKVRYLHSGNRYGKTAAAMADNYFLLTGRHPFRPIPKFPSSIISIGPDYTNYASMVFEPKYVDGEPDSYLTPVFPEGGRWRHSYNRNTKTLRLGCAACAAKNMSRECPHPKPALYLCSDQGKPESIAGGQHGKLAIDEIVKKEFYDEGMQRLKATLGSYCDVTLTPTMGEAWWTYTDLKVPFDDPTYKNEYYHPLLKRKVKYVDVFTGSQYEGNLVLHSEIDAEVAKLERQEGGHEIIRLRIWGEHVSLAGSKVFDQPTVRLHRENVRPPLRGNLEARDETPDRIREVLRETTGAGIEFVQSDSGMFRVWKKPDPKEQYIIGADVAEGLTGQDNSVAHVYCMRPLHGRIHLEHVAKFRGALNPIPYSYAVYKLSRWYNDALIVPERNGPGHTVIHELTDELYWYNLFHGTGKLSNIAESLERQYGITMSGDSKPTIISVAQSTWKSGNNSYIATYDREFLFEMEHYIQESSEKGYTKRFKGEGTCHDDEVTAFMMASYAIGVLPDVYDLNWESHTHEDKDKYAHLSPEDAKFWRGVHGELEQQRRKDEEEQW